jgi:hypothetical protein
VRAASHEAEHGDQRDDLAPGAATVILLNDDEGDRDLAVRPQRVAAGPVSHRVVVLFVARGPRSAAPHVYMLLRGAGKRD